MTSDDPHIRNLVTRDAPDALQDEAQANLDAAADFARTVLIVGRGFALGAAAGLVAVVIWLLVFG